MDVRMSLSKTSSEQEVWLHDPDCVRNVFLCTFQCVWCYLTCENGKIRVIWQTDGSAVMVEADNGSSCCVWGFPPHSSSWMFPLTSDLSTVWSDTSFHRMIAETFSSVPGATADASAVRKKLEPTLCRMMKLMESFHVSRSIIYLSTAEGGTSYTFFGCYFVPFKWCYHVVLLGHVQFGKRMLILHPRVPDLVQFRARAIFRILLYGAFFWIPKFSWDEMDRKMDTIL